MRVILLITAVLLAGCAADAPPVSVELYQTRSDVPRDMMEIQVRNEGSTSVTVERARLLAPGLRAVPVWEREVEIAPGSAVDLKVALPPALCEGRGAAEVTLTVAGREWSVPAKDRYGQLADYVGGQCFRQKVLAAGDVRVTGLRGDRLQLQVGGSLQVGSFGTTTLFRPADPLAAARGEPVRLRPNRCDAHALADDKQGTYFPLTVTLPDGTSGEHRLDVDPALRGQLYRLYARMCGL